MKEYQLLIGLTSVLVEDVNKFEQLTVCFNVGKNSYEYSRRFKLYPIKDSIDGVLLLMGGNDNKLFDYYYDNNLIRYVNISDYNNKLKMYVILKEITYYLNLLHPTDQL